MKKRNIFLCVLVFLLGFIITTALLWTPQVKKESHPEDVSYANTLYIEDISYFNNCKLDSKGNIKITDIDAFIVFGDLPKIGQKFVVNFEPLREDTTIELFYNEGWGFIEGHKATVQCKKEDIKAEFFIDSDKYMQLRLDVDIPYKLQSIDVYQIRIDKENVTTNTYWWLWALIVGFVVSVITFFLDKKFSISSYLLEKLEVLWKNTKENKFYLLGIGALTIITSVLMTGIPYLETYQLYEFVLSSAFSLSCYCAIFCVWKYRNNLVENFDKVFVILLLCVGVLLVVVAPMAHSSWDTDVHYRLALEASYLGDTKMTQTDIMIKEARDFAWLRGQVLPHYNNMLNLTLNYQEVITTYEGGISLAHLPAGIFIALGRLMGVPFAIIFMMGKLANLLVYTTVCYFGLRKLKSGKLLYAVVALFPTNVMLACSYSYDYWVTAFSLLGMAYYISFFQQEDKNIATKDTIIMCGALGLACIPKEIYVPLLLMPFMLSQKRIKNPKRYYRICMVALFVTLALFLVATMGETTSEGDARGGVGISPSGQIAFIFGNIFKYAIILLKFLLFDYLNILSADQYISNFSYIGLAGGTFVVGILLLLTFLYDKDEAYSKETRTGWKNRSYVLLMYFGGSALIATALYLVFNPVGSETIVGCQHRYIIPWIYPLLSVWSLNGIKPRIPKKILYWIVTIGSFGLLYYDIFTVVLPEVIVI